MNEPGTSCSIFSTSSLPTSSMALTRYTGAHMWERACWLPSSMAGRCVFIQSCACTVSFIMRHDGHPRWRRVKDDNSGDEFRVCSVQPIPHPIMCTVLSHATMLPLPSTCCHHPLHAAAVLYMLPPPLSPCHPCCPYVPSPALPLATASMCHCHHPLQPMRCHWPPHCLCLSCSTQP